MSDKFTTENLLDAICDHLGVDVYENELFLSGMWSNDNPIKVAKRVNIQIQSVPSTKRKGLSDEPRDNTNLQNLWENIYNKG